MNQSYIDTVRLLIDIAPDIFSSPRFAMKGGTAMNLFVQDMPRLSVDIDVVFTDHMLVRDDALAAIQADLKLAAENIEARGLSVTLPQKPGGEDVKLFVRNDAVEVKVEVNHIFRGTVLPVETRSLVARAQDIFTAEIAVPMLALAEVYGSKLVAAMDRQHPRDIFDVLKMYETYGLRMDFVDCFVVYLAGHNRPVHEVLFSNDAPLEAIYENHFKGMTTEEVALETLLETRKRLKAELPVALTQKHRAFLLSLVSAEPDWGLLPCAHVRDLPAIKWKLANLAKLKEARPDQFKKQHDELAARLSV